MTAYRLGTAMMPRVTLAGTLPAEAGSKFNPRSKNGALGPGFSDYRRLGDGLPGAPVWDLDYDPADDVLVAGTMGRGAFIFLREAASDPAIELVPGPVRVGGTILFDVFGGAGERFALVGDTDLGPCVRAGVLLDLMCSPRFRVISSSLVPLVAGPPLTVIPNTSNSYNTQSVRDGTDDLLADARSPHAAKVFSRPGSFRGGSDDPIGIRG